MMNKIVYFTGSRKVVGLYSEDTVLPVGAEVADCKNFHRHFHLSVYNPETQEMEIQDEGVQRYIEFEKIRRKKEAEREVGFAFKKPVRYNGALWDADSNAVKNITNWIQFANIVDTLPEGFAWRDANNEMHPFTDPKALSDHLTKILELILKRETRLLRELWAEKDRISQMSTMEDVEAYGTQINLSV